MNGMNEALNGLIEQLHHPDGNVRRAAALTLGKLGDINTLDILLQALCTEPDLFVREDLTWALVRLGDAAISPLMHRLHDANPAVRHHVAHTLGKIGDSRAVDSLMKTLQDTDAVVVAKAAFALGQIGDVQAIPALVGLLGHTHHEIQVTVNTVLEQFGAAASQPLRHALAHEQPQVREQAADILGLIGDDEAVLALIPALQDDHWEVRFAAVNALGHIGSKSAASALQTAQNDADQRVRSLALTLLKHNARPIPSARTAKTAK